MALWTVQTRKAINTNGIVAKWSNRYITEDAGPAEALQRALNYWVNAERLFHGALVFCYEVYVNRIGDAPFTPGFSAAVPVGVQRGARAQTAASTVTLLPLWNVIRVDFPVNNSRPNRKFYRTALLESDVTSAQLDADVGTGMQAGLDILATSTGHRDTQGNTLLGSYIIRGLTSKRLGRESAVSVPPGPAFG